MSGILQRTAITTTPSSCEAALAGKTKLTNSDITEAFTVSSVNTLCLLNVTLDDSAVVELASRVSSSSTLEEFALVNCTGITSDSWATLFGALVENGSITRVEIEGCNLSEVEAKALATDVIPWNRNIVVWNIGNNPNIGDEGATAFVGALMQAQSCLTKLAFNNVGLASANVANTVINDLSALTALIQIDISHNPGVFDPSTRNALVTLDDTLKKNAKMHNANPSEHVSIVDAIQQDMEALAAAAPAPPKQTKAKKPPAKTPNSGGGTPRRNSPARRASDAKVETPQKVQRGTAQRTPSGVAQQSPTPRHSPMRRAASAGTAPKASSSPMRRSSTPLQREVDDGYEEWKRIKDEYNKYIKDCSRPTKAAPIVVKEPKYVLGKPLEKLKHSPSRMFRPTQAVREPNPEERRKLAPWLTDPNEAKKTCPGRKYLFTDEKADPKLGVKIAIIDGGYISAIEDDPRDMGYYARKVQNGEVPKGRTGAFASSTPRECRWGTSTRDQVVKRAQAPGPGYYCVKSEWEIRAEKDKAIAMKNAEGGRGFNSSSRRNVFTVKKVDPNDTHVYHVPGPGAYEIP